ncbi:metallophosphoesterase [Thalassospira xianhensis]|uniref:metallophosphoesterase family protein n=1 Tax=Thalassospira xianhensis TaxID=478503 RepID=UPI000DED841E|nr:metallophosphoesterase [Thalassospira xianhensis]
MTTPSIQTFNDLIFYGDPHGNFDPLIKEVRSSGARAVFLLGDMEPDANMDEILAPVYRKVGFENVFMIPGNHDSDNEIFYHRVFGSRLASNNLHGRIVTVDSMRIAGLGGVFRKKVWFPKLALDEPWTYKSPEEYVQRIPPHARWRKGLPLKQRTSIFPSEFQTLSEQTCDILITHEAPLSTQPRSGFQAIDELARSMEASFLVHGHLHIDYQALPTESLKACVVGCEMAQVKRGADINRFLNCSVEQPQYSPM